MVVSKAQEFVAPATSAQRGLWVTQQMDAASSAYHVSHAYRLSGQLDVASFRRALSQLVARHEALRTSFMATTDDLFQVIVEEVDLESVFRCEDLPAGTASQQAVHCEFAESFASTDPSMFRVRLFVDPDGGSVLTIVAHHLIVDARSLRILFEELSALYLAETTGSPAGLPEPGLQLGDYGDWEQRWIAAGGHLEHVDHFRGALAGAPAAIDLPLAHRDGSLGRGHVSGVHLDGSVAADLLALAARHNCTPFVVLLAVFSGVLHRWSAQDVVVVGTSVSVRSEPGLERAVGLFVNSLPVPVAWGDDPTFADALLRVRESVLESVARNRCPFDRLVADLSPPREPGREPLFQVMFGMESGPEEPWTLAGLSVEPLPQPVSHAKFDLSLDVFMDGDSVRCDLEWSDQLFDEKSADCFLEHLVAAAGCVVRDESARVGEWPLSVRRDIGTAADNEVLDSLFVSPGFAAARPNGAGSAGPVPPGTAPSNVRTAACD